MPRPFFRFPPAAVAALLLATPWGVAAQQAERGDDHHRHEHGDRVHGFDDAERWAERFNDPARDAWQRPGHVVDLLGLAPGMTVADLGAGTGYFVPHLSRAVGPGGRVVALDVSPEMVAWLSEETLPALALDNAEARLVERDDPGLAAGSVDRVLVVNTWHHVPAREAYAARLAEALAPGGEVWVLDFTLEADEGPPVEMRLTPEEVAAELAAGGLEAEVVAAEELPKQYAVVGRRSAS